MDTAIIGGQTRGPMGMFRIGSALLIATVCANAFFVVGAQSPPQRPSLPPTPLEAFAAQAGARTTWSKFIGRLDGRLASAIVTAVAVSGPDPAAPIMRGIKIELRHEGLRRSCNLKHVEWSIMCAREWAAIYIEEDRLPQFRAAVLRGRAEVHAGHPVGITHIMSGTEGPGILITGYNLYGPTLEDLAGLLDGAVAQLKNAPRAGG